MVSEVITQTVRKEKEEKKKYFLLVCIERNKPALKMNPKLFNLMPSLCKKANVK